MQMRKISLLAAGIALLLTIASGQYLYYSLQKSRPLCTAELLYLFRKLTGTEHRNENPGRAAMQSVSAYEIKRRMNE